MQGLRGQVWISAVLYILVAVVILVVVLQAGLPMLNKMRDKAAFTQTRDMLLGIDSYIREVASEGQGSQRIVPIDVRQGDVVLSNSSLQWKLTTEARVVEPRSSVSFGNLKVRTNADVSITELSDVYEVSNSNIKVIFYKNETPGAIATSALIKNITLLSDGTVVPGGFDIKIGPGAINSGTGYTSVLIDGIEVNMTENQTKQYYGNVGVRTYLNNSNVVAKLDLYVDGGADYVRVKIS